jgi:hypothetical protein
MPQVNEGAGDLLAGACEHVAGELDRPSLSTGVSKIAALRRTWFEEWPFGFGNRRLIAVVTRGCRRKPLLGKTGVPIQPKTGDTKCAGPREFVGGMVLDHRRSSPASFLGHLAPPPFGNRRSEGADQIDLDGSAQTHANHRQPR